MNRFSKALEQAAHDRQEQRTSPGIAISAPSHPPAGNGRFKSTPAAQTQKVRPQGVDQRLVSLLSPATFEAEQYRALRHTIEQRHRAAGLQVIAVTSAAVGDGKTTTAINLAGALAQAADARVLLVDADLRRPALGGLLGFRGGSGGGLVSAIMDPALGLAQIIQERPPFNLSVICAEQRPSSPYEVLKSPRLASLLDEARARFDYVIVDAPPLVPVQDCRIIGRWVDGFLMVVRAHRTPRRLLEEAFNVVDPAKMIGLVFNGDAHPRSGYHSGYYAGYAAAASAAVNGKGKSVWGRVKTMGARLRPGGARP